MAFGQGLAGNRFRSLIYCWILKSCRGVCPGGSPGSFRDRWGPLALAVIWIIAPQQCTKPGLCCHPSSSAWTGSAGQEGKEGQTFCDKLLNSTM